MTKVHSFQHHITHSYIWNATVIHNVFTLCLSQCLCLYLCLCLCLCLSTSTSISSTSLSISISISVPVSILISISIYQSTEPHLIIIWRWVCEQLTAKQAANKFVFPSEITLAELNSEVCRYYIIKLRTWSVSFRLVVPYCNIKPTLASDYIGTYIPGTMEHGRSVSSSGLILGLRPANERRRYFEEPKISPEVYKNYFKY